jgi:hypothetical protein
LIKIPHALIIEKINTKNFLNLTKNLYKKTTANISFNGERLKIFSLWSGKRQKYLFLQVLFSKPGH